MWKTSPFVQLFQDDPALRFVTCHNCARGGTRDKLTCLATSVVWFDASALRCDKQQSHEPWTPVVVNSKVHYPTHSEAAYPETLCERMASILLAIVVSQGAIVAPTFPQHVQVHNKTLNRVVLGALPRGKNVKPLLSEFGTYINVIVSAQSDESLKSFVGTLPTGSNMQSRLTQLRSGSKRRCWPTSLWNLNVMWDVMLPQNLVLLRSKVPPILVVPKIPITKICWKAVKALVMTFRARRL